MSWLYNLSGFVALGLFLFAYAMVNLGLWRESEFRFHLPNLLGAMFMIVSLMGQPSMPMRGLRRVRWWWATCISGRIAMCGSAA